MNRTRRLVVAGAALLAAAALSQGAGSAFAATPAAAATSVTATPAAKVSITAKASTASVKAWQQFTVTGRTTGLAAGTGLTLQQKQHGTWVSLPARTVVNRDHSYYLRVELGLHGLNQLRIVSGSASSAVFEVTIH
ncbi:hypothetical protein NGB36_05440 [Streptomyces sp. RB6PN25]|uniref:Uncharacterized protein n=1 Tax=Streptomyces humicola TaxID=2953240 RepID=A0ABT1PQV8_9ACTN|nr:hypothetical protein [Streptomyces humicola]MCQ4080049.1 hypothetical protein [Streptomyces humicola]